MVGDGIDDWKFFFLFVGVANDWIFFWLRFFFFFFFFLWPLVMLIVGGSEFAIDGGDGLGRI